jgi:adenosylcobinamide kinase/adenosylcobinamide-phosphate guanylyltransferase
MKQLLIGGARSGKSSLAKQQALAWQAKTQGQVLVIATAKCDASDSAMARRIAHHQLARPANWQLIEVPINLAETIKQMSNPQTLILVDCLTLWLSDELFDHTSLWKEKKKQLIDAVSTIKGPIILIGNEVGQSVVPLGEGNRLFVDEMGWLHQHLAKVVDNVTMTIAGLPLVLKNEVSR